MKKLVVLFSIIVATITLQAQTESNSPLETGRVGEAIKLLDNGENKAAFDLLLTELKSNPKNGYAYWYLAYICQYSTAEQLAIEEDYFELLQSQEFLLENYQSAFKNIPAKDKYYKSLCLIYSALVCRDNEDLITSNKYIDKALKFNDAPAVLIEKGQNYILMGRYEDALNVYNKALSIEASSKIYLGLAITLINLEQYDEAINAAIKVLEFDDEYYSRASAQIARAFIAKEEIQDAILPAVTSYLIDQNSLAEDIVDYLIDNEPEGIIAQLKITQTKASDEEKILQIKHLLARAYFNGLFDYRNTIKYELDVCNAYPDFMYGLYMLTYSYQMIGEYDEALLYVDKLIALDTLIAHSYEMKSDIYYAMGNLNAALEEVNTAISISPEESGLYTTRAAVYRYMGKIDDAIDDYFMSITLNPESSYSVLQRGILLKQQNKNILAEADFRKAIELDSIAGQCVCMAYAYWFLGDKQKAIATFVEGYANNQIDDYNAACLYSLMNEKELALRYFERTLDSGYCNFAHIEYDTDLDNIRNTPEFKALIEKYRKQ